MKAVYKVTLERPDLPDTDFDDATLGDMDSDLIEALIDIPGHIQLDRKTPNTVGAHLLLAAHNVEQGE